MKSPITSRGQVSAADRSAALRALPSVEALLHEPAIADLAARYSHAPIVDLIRGVLDDERTAIDGGTAPSTRAGLVSAVVKSAQDLWRPSPRPVINATGVIIHTNLGRAPLSEAGIAAMRAVAAGYSNLEFDLASGERGSRHSHIDGMLSRLVGAESALVVNNNASAVLLALAANAKGREVIVSRGHAVEIGGRFRIPDVMRQSGCRLVEVGTTNRTRLADYEEAITPRTAALLHVHTSNFRLIGFTEEVGIAELVGLGKRRGVAIIDDLGSGSLLDTAKYGLAHEPMVQESVAAGADLVCFSGDKLLGGPQAGLVAGRREPVERMRRWPLARAVRVDKCTIAALHATLLAYVRGAAEREIPVWRMISARLDELNRRAGVWADSLTQAGIAATVSDGESTVGGGSLPGEVLPTRLVSIEAGTGRSAPAAAGRLAARLRAGDPPVVARVDRGRLLLDPRTVAPSEEPALLAAVIAAAR